LLIAAYRLMHVIGEPLAKLDEVATVYSSILMAGTLATFGASTTLE
jgi:hypothetical protein